MISPKETLLLVIDIQGKLAVTVFQSERIIRNASKLIRSCKLLGVPVIHTEQYPKGLGRTVEELQLLIGEAKPFEKSSFSCCGNEEFMKHLRSLGGNDILVVGAETHVCVYQTCVELLEFGYNVHLVTDAVSSRSEENRTLGIRCIERAGAAPTSTEMAIFELLRIAEGDTFKAISKIIKED
ncbi:MAG: hydrolase [Chlorobiaceae bacterium]|nr:hydrolase [Chlorobiaceae bacterium]